MFALLAGACLQASAQRYLYLSDDVRIDAKPESGLHYFFDKYGQLRTAGPNDGNFDFGKISSREKVALVMDYEQWKSPRMPGQLIAFFQATLAEHIHHIKGLGTTPYGPVEQYKYLPPGEHIILPSQKEHIKFVGDWAIANPSKTVCHCSYSNQPGDYLEIVFSGTGIKVVSEKQPHHGVAKIILDGNVVATVDNYSETPVTEYVAYEVSGLKSKQHVVKIEVTGEKNEASTDPYFSLKGFEITNEAISNAESEIIYKDSIVYKQPKIIFDYGTKTTEFILK